MDTQDTNNCNDPMAECGTQGTEQFICSDGEHTCTNNAARRRRFDTLTAPNPAAAVSAPQGRYVIARGVALGQAFKESRGPGGAK